MLLCLTVVKLVSHFCDKTWAKGPFKKYVTLFLHILDASPAPNCLHTSRGTHTPVECVTQVETYWFKDPPIRTNIPFGSSTV